MKTIHLYVQDSFADWEAAYLLPELRTGRFFRPGLDPFAVKTVSLGGAAVTSMGGLRVAPDMALDQVRPEESALLVLPGADHWLEPAQAPAVALARQFLEAGRLTAAICGATLGLAQAGLLNERPHTSNDLGFLKSVCPAYRGEAFYKNQPAVAGANLVTASGAASLEFAREVLALLDVFSPATLEAWYGLHKTQEPARFYDLLASLQPAAS